MKPILKLLIFIALACLLSACATSAKDRHRAEYTIEPCIGLEGEELRDCLVDRAKELTDEIIDKANN